jgi:L-alanine-DL-glutamate epimerase-like enolase superfamily enzyme
MGFTWFKMDLYLSSLIPGGYTTASQINSYGYRPISINNFTGLEQYARTYRSLIGDYPLTSDHYQGYDNFTSQLSVDSAVELANRMAASDCQGMFGGWMEDIIDWGWTDSQGIPVIKQVTDQTDMPILTGEDMYGLDQYKAFADVGAVDFIHPDQATAGGIHEPRLAAMYAHEKGIRTALHCSGGPVSFATSLHIAAGIPDFLALEYHHTDESCNTWFDAVVDGFIRPFIQSDGHSIVPDGPGLGITPNATASSHGLSWSRVT